MGKVVCGLNATGRDADSGGEVLDLATETKEFTTDVGAPAVSWVAKAVRCSGPWDGSAETWGCAAGML